MNELIAYFKNNMSLPQNIETHLRTIIKEREVSKGEVIVRSNTMVKQHIFVKSGCLRSYYTTESGKEHTVQFAIENWWISDYITLYTNQKSLLSIESLTPSKILIISKEDVEAMYASYPPFETFQRNKFEKRVATLQKRVLALLSLTATEKYSQFLKDYADFEKVIPNYQIASYLGITPQSLSRLRKEHINS